MVPVREEMAWMDGVTGTIKRRTDWVVGLSTGERTEPSALDLRLRTLGANVPPRWHHIQGDSRTLLGGVTARSHGSAPRILSLGPDLLKLFVDASTDDEVVAFARAMQSGTDAEQRFAVEHLGTMSGLP